VREKGIEERKRAINSSHTGTCGLIITNVINKIDLKRRGFEYSL